MTRSEHPNRILVVANETLGGRALFHLVVERAAAEGEVLVVAPALNGRLRHWLSDTDGARRAAGRRLVEMLAALAAAGIFARGEIGDADPVQAIADALGTFPADEIVVATHPPRRSNWLERGVVGASERFGLPVTHVVVDVAAEHPAAA